ncbi:SAYSvFN domain-containing protein 1 [Trichoplusia ni]|uniref:SAYSvFN domain-containing protein 1 n=1 Tax=Trichoplusia ni TaxID=7111 RepID=A0A7E5WQP2_TRINI|nr:SAYSvFN domain-containing protein 1 [Trichoplusia ni]
MEAKLKEYRALRRRKELIENTKEALQQTKDKVVDFIVPKIIQNMGKIREEEILLIENEDLIAHASHVEEIPPEEARSETSEVESYEEEESCGYCMIKLPIYALIWLGLYAYFLYLQFGAVFFVISVLIGIYINTRTRPRKKGEVSAYSVFNEDCASIDGTLTPEQFEREIRYGAGTVRSF